MVAMKQLCDSSSMTREVAFCPFWYAFTAPCDECILWQTSVRIFNLDVCELDAAVRELINQVRKLAFAGALYLEHTFFSGTILESIRERCRNRKDSPLAVRRRGGCGTGRWRCVDY